MYWMVLTSLTPNVFFYHYTTCTCHSIKSSPNVSKKYTFNVNTDSKTLRNQTNQTVPIGQRAVKQI